MTRQIEDTMLDHLMSDEFRAKLRGLPTAGPRIEQSAARKRIAETFDEISDAKRRGVTWQAIADLMNEDGIRATNGSPLTAAHVSAAYSAEKAARGERKRRRKGKPAPAATAAQQPAQQPRDTPAFDPNDGTPADKPRPKFSGPSKPR